MTANAYDRQARYCRVSGDFKSVQVHHLARRANHDVTTTTGQRVVCRSAERNIRIHTGVVRLPTSHGSTSFGLCMSVMKSNSPSSRIHTLGSLITGLPFTASRSQSPVQGESLVRQSVDPTTSRWLTGGGF